MLGHPTPLADGKTSRLGPGAHLRHIRGTARVRRAPSTSAAGYPAAVPPGRAEERTQASAQLRRIRRTQINLVEGTIEGEGHRLIGLTAGQVIDECDLDLLRHDFPFDRRWILKKRKQPPAEKIKYRIR